MLVRLKNLLFTNRSTKQTIVKNVFWLSVGQIGSRLIRAIIIIYAARVLGAAEYGIFSYVLGLATFFTIFADLGLSPLLTREIASHYEKRSTIFASAFWLKILLLAITALLVIFVAPKFSNIKEAIPLLPFVALLVALDNLRDFIFSYFRGIEKMELEGFLVVIMNSVIALAGFIILSFKQTAGALLFSYIASVAALSVAAFYFIRDLLKRIFKDFNKDIARQFIYDCWPLAFAGLFGIFMLNIDIIMLGWWRTSEEIGYYSASQKVVQIFYTLSAIIATAVFPTLSRFVKQGILEKAKLLNEKIISLLYLLALPLSTGGVILAQPIIKLLFGKEYLPASLPFQILILTLLIQFPAPLLSNSLTAHNQQRKFAYYIGLGSLSNVVFNALFIPIWGINGAALATVIAQSAYIFPLWLKIKKINNFYTLRHLKKIGASAAIMGLISFIFNQIGINVVINIILSVGVYFIMLYLIKEEAIQEVKELLIKLKVKN
jgi:O-antigen/teichoic acid export membrane protein